MSCLSRNSCSVQSSARESFLGSWQQSFSLTSSVAEVTSEDVPALEVKELVSEQYEQEQRPLSTQLCSVSLNDQTLLDPQFFSSSVKERNREDGNELTLQPDQSDSLSATDEITSSSKAECSHGNSSRLLQHPSQFDLRSTYPKANSRNHSCLEKSHNSLLHKRDSSAPNNRSVAGLSRVDSVLWDDLPFSESLNEFLARIEDGKSVVSLSAGKQTLTESSELDVNLNKSYSRQTLVAADLPEASVSGRLLPLAENNSWENILLARFQSNRNALSAEVSQCESSSGVSSSTDKEYGASSVTPSPHLPVLSPFLPVTSNPSVPESRSVQPKEASVDISKSASPFISLQCTAEHGESSRVKRSKAAACVLAAQDSCLAGGGNKHNSSTPSQRTDLTLTGAWDFDPPSTMRRIYNRKLNPLTELSENIFRSVNRREMLWNSIFPEGSYNASADLFDASAREAGKPVEFFNKLCNSVTEEDTLAEKVTPPESVLWPGDGLSKSSKLSSSLHRSPSDFSKHSTPLTYTFCDPDWSSVSTQDFVPYSQSTPMTKPLQKLWPVAEKSSLVTTFTPKNHSKRKRSRSSFQNTLLQQLTGRLVKQERPSSREDKENYSCASQQFPNSQPPADFEEWIPPSASKRLKRASSNLTTVNWAAALQSACGHGSRSPISESKESSENGACFQNERLKPGDTARILTTPASAGAIELSSFNATVLEVCSPPEGKSRLSNASHSGAVLGGAAGWSPELFFQAQTPFSRKPKY